MLHLPTVVFKRKVCVAATFPTISSIESNLCILFLVT